MSIGTFVIPIMEMWFWRKMGWMDSALHLSIAFLFCACEWLTPSVFLVAHVFEAEGPFISAIVYSYHGVPEQSIGNCCGLWFAVKFLVAIGALIGVSFTPL